MKNMVLDYWGHEILGTLPAYLRPDADKTCVTVARVELTRWHSAPPIFQPMWRANTRGIDTADLREVLDV